MQRRCYLEKIFVAVISSTLILILRKRFINIIDNPGKFRKRDVQAALSNIVYALAPTVPDKMRTLFEFVNTEKAKIADTDQDKIQKMFLLGTIFAETAASNLLYLLE